MSEFRIGGQTVVSLDPEVSYGGRDEYGNNGGGRLISGPHEAYSLHWNYIPDAEFAALKSRIDSANGVRLPFSLPIGSSSSWATKFGNLRLAGGWTRTLRGYVANVTVEATGVSDTQ